jgi:hypothetical protein
MAAPGDKEPAVTVRPRRTATLAAALALTTAGLIPAANPARATNAAAQTLVAAPTGAGTDCTQAAPCGLAAAQAKARTLAGPGQSGDVRVVLRGGTYRLGSTLTFGPEDSGGNGFDVTYQAADGERPVLTGARRVTGFQRVDAARDIWRAAVPAGTNTRQLYVNGVRAERARTALNPATFTPTATGFTATNASYASFTNQSDVEVVQNNKWKHMRCPLASITRSGSGSALTVAQPCWDNNNVHVVNRQFPFNGNGLPKMDNVSWLENAFQLLTRPGQWYLDRPAAALYYIPRPGESMATAEVELPVLQTLVAVRGTPGHLAPVDDTDTRATYTGAWSTSTGRKLGDYGDGVHATKSNGASVTVTFTGTGLDLLAETNTDQGTFSATVDGVPDTRKAWTQRGTTRLAQQVVYSVKGLSKGPHTVKLTSTSTSFFLVDAFVVVPDVEAPVHDLAFRGLTFTGTTWLLPSTDGYVDNQSGIQWAKNAPHAPLRPAAAVEVHRGRGVTLSGNTFTHLGGDGLAFADGTQDSVIERNTVNDIAASGIAVGNVDDYFFTDQGRMTLGVTVADNTVETPGQDYQENVGIWVGHSRDTVVTHNEVRHTPYSGMSIGWGWGFASACPLQTNPRPGGQGLATCRRGTIYSGNNKVTGNHVHDVMRTLLDGGAIYTLGGQGNGGGTVRSEYAANWFVQGNNTNFMLYHDEGSSFWNTHDNVVSTVPTRWVGMWTPTIHDIAIHDNFTDQPNFRNDGTNVTITNTTVVTNGQWPPAARAIMDQAGPR